MNGFPIWCSQYEQLKEENTLILSLTVFEEQKITRDDFMSEFVLLSSVFLVLDISWMVMVWVATSVGTPTQPKGRDEYLR